MKTKYPFFFALLFVFLIPLYALQAADWRQFHGNGPNNGFIPVRTSVADDPAWTLNVGEIKGSSPVIGPDGTVYVGNARGQLWAVNPNGTLRWRVELARGWNVDTPAVGADGRIYVACTLKAKERDHRQEEGTRRWIRRSRLFCVNSNGRIQWIYTPSLTPLPDGNLAYKFFTSTPKLLEKEGETHIFLVLAFWNTYNQLQQNYLVVINGNGRHEATRYLSDAFFVEIGGGGGFQRALHSLASGEIGPKPLPDGAALPSSAIAIVDFGSFSEEPLIIVCDDADDVTAFRWQNDTIASNSWHRKGSSTTFKYIYNSPAAFYNGSLLLGRSDGQIFLLDALTGNELFRPWPRLGSAVLSTAAAFLRQIYLITKDGEAVMLDSDGTVVKKTSLGAQSASSPAMSANYIYVNAADGIYTLGFDLEKIAHYEFQGGGTSSPAIDENGTVYTVGKNTLYAFPKQ